MFGITLCKHNYKVVDVIQCQYIMPNGNGESIPITLLECEDCGARKVERSHDFLYASTLLERLDKWVNGHSDFYDI